jgi:hypothetical protein
MIISLVIQTMEIHYFFVISLFYISLFSKYTQTNTDEKFDSVKMRRDYCFFNNEMGVNLFFTLRVKFLATILLDQRNGVFVLFKKTSAD